MPFIDNEKTSSRIKFDKEKQFHHRGDGDLGILAEQVQWKKMAEHPFKGGAVLDLGGHVGAFVRYMRENSDAGSFVSVEPDPNNTRVFRKNCPGVELLEAAALDSPGVESIDLYLGRTYPACNSVHGFRGRQVITVPVVQWKSLLAREPWVGIKCDIEGGEYLLSWEELPRSVGVVAVEYHYHRPGWEELQVGIHDQLLSQGFAAFKEPRVNHFSKITIGVYRR